MTLVLPCLLPWLGALLLLRRTTTITAIAWLLSVVATVVCVAHVVELANLAGWSGRQLAGLKPARLNNGWFGLGVDGAVLMLLASLVGSLALAPLPFSTARSVATRHRSMARGLLVQGMLAAVVLSQGLPIWLWGWFLASALGGLLALGPSHAHQASDPPADEPGHPLAAFLVHRGADAALCLGTFGLLLATASPLDNPTSWLDNTATTTRAAGLSLWQPMDTGLWAGTTPRTAATWSGLLCLLGVWIRIGGLPFAAWCAPSRRLHRMSFLYSYEVVGLLGLWLWQLQPLLLLAPEVRAGLVVAAVVAPAATVMWVMWPRHNDGDHHQVWRRADEASVAGLGGLLLAGAASGDQSLLVLGLAAVWLLGTALSLATDGIRDDPASALSVPPWSPRGLEKRQPRAHTTRLLATVAAALLMAVVLGPPANAVMGMLPWAVIIVMAVAVLVVGFGLGRCLRPFAGPPDPILAVATKPGLVAAGGMMLAFMGMGLPLLSLPPELLATPDSSYQGPLSTWLMFPQQQLEGVLQSWPSSPPSGFAELVVMAIVLALVVVGIWLGRFLPVWLRPRSGDAPLSVAVDVVRDGTQSLSRLLAQQLVPMVWNVVFGALPAAAAAVLGWLNRVWHSGSMQWATAVGLGWAAWWLST
jgi:hypothetical protein